MIALRYHTGFLRIFYTLIKSYTFVIASFLLIILPYLMTIPFTGEIHRMHLVRGRWTHFSLLPKCLRNNYFLMLI